MLADELLARAKEKGIDLVGPDGLVDQGLTKVVLESALMAELTEHLGNDACDPTRPWLEHSRNGPRRPDPLATTH